MVFTGTDTCIYVRNQCLKCGFPLVLCQNTIDGVLHVIQSIRFCNGVVVTENDNIPKTFEREEISTLPDENATRSVARSKTCKMILPFYGKNVTCSTCVDSLAHHRKKWKNSASQK